MTLASARAETESSPVAAAACKSDKRARQRSPSTEMVTPSGACPFFRGSSRAPRAALTRLPRACSAAGEAFDVRRVCTREAGEKARRGARARQQTTLRLCCRLGFWARHARRPLTRRRAQGTLSYRVHFEYEGAPMSPWCVARAPRPTALRSRLFCAGHVALTECSLCVCRHDIPLHATPNGLVHFVCEVRSAPHARCRGGRGAPLRLPRRAARARAVAPSQTTASRHSRQR
jgi:hypothetical protein